jgi:apolipoprotein N-acyltransferase
MEQIQILTNPTYALNKIRPAWFLVIGIMVMTATHMSFSIDLVAWVSSVPFLLYLRKTTGWKSRLLFALALVTAWSFVTAKIISPPIPYLLVFMYSIPLTLFHLPGYLVWDRFKNRNGSFFLFPAVMTTMEWVQYTFTPFASWGVAAYTQSHSIVMMQTVSLVGMAGLSFLIYWVNISISEYAVKKTTTLLTYQILLILLFVLLLFGTLRYEISKSTGKKLITVAAVGTDSEVSGLPLPTKAVNDKIKAALFDRTRIAAKGGAVLVVWNEAATFILPTDEPIWKDSLAALASTLNIALVASYVLPVLTAPLTYENKYLFIDSTGTIISTYHKHQPVPGEPTTKGTEPLKVFEHNGTKIGGAICYDYDFPYLAKGFGTLNADIVALPSSDWRGIDPLHSRMAAFRAVEQGHSILRSTRFGLSAAITPYGEMVSQLSSFDKNDKIMIAHLPAKGITTVYAVIGDLFIYLCMGFVLVFFTNTIFKKTH